VFAELEAKLAAVASERDEYKRLATFLQRELDRLRDLQKTPREHVDSSQVQLAFAEMAKQLLEQAEARGTADKEEGKSGGSGDSKRKRNHTPHGRAVLPEHLPVETLLIKPKPVPEGAVRIGEEVSWRLGFRPATFFRLKLVRPVFVVRVGQVPATVETIASQHLGEVSDVPSSTESEMPMDPSDGSVTVRAENPAVPESTRIDAEDFPPAVVVESPAIAVNISSPSTAAVPESPSAELDATTILCAGAPEEIIPRGLPTIDLLAHILTGKFADKLPFNRQEGIFARSSVHITRGTMCGWAEQAHGLARFVVDAMCEEARERAHFIATDATGVLVQANEKCKTGHFWVFVADHDHVFYRYSQRHSSDEPKTFLRGFRGTVVADASNVYDALFRLPDGPEEAGCNAHARRYFYKALATNRERALIGIGFFNRLFELERAFAKLPPAERLRLRKEQSAPVVAKLAEWRDEQLGKPDVADGTPIRRALNYLRNHWDALTRFLLDGKIPISNNRSELELRRLVIGRANWVFVGSDDSAAWTCTFVSLVASCQLHGIDPEAYLRDLFRVLPLWPRNRALELAPKYWRATRAGLDPEELKLPLGPLTLPPPPTAAGEQAAEKPDAEQGSRAEVLVHGP
jgi:hypothetical protein